MIYCNNGRTRSPSFVAAYLIVVCCMSPTIAYANLSKYFIEFRGSIDGNDRDNRIFSHLEYLVHALQQEVIPDMFPFILG